MQTIKLDDIEVTPNQRNVMVAISNLDDETEPFNVATSKYSVHLYGMHTKTHQASLRSLQKKGYLRYETYWRGAVVRPLVKVI